MLSTTILSALFFSLPLLAQEIAPAAAVSPPKFVTTDAYPLDTCVVSGRQLGADAVATEIEGRVFKTCSDRCPERIHEDPKKYAGKLDEAVVAAQKPVYPLDTCPVSGQKLGSMGDPHQLVLDNHLILLCCDGCVSRATARKDEIIGKLQQAAFAKQKAAYTATTCPVPDGEKLESGEMVHVMHGLRLVKLCSEGCMETLQATPNRYAAKVAPGAAKPKQEAPAEKKHEDGRRYGEPGGHEQSERRGHEHGLKGEMRSCGTSSRRTGCGARP